MPTAPPVAVARLADQLGVDPVELRSYGRRAKTRTEHLRLVAQYLGWRPPLTLELKELDEFLLARAMEHDSPTLLFRLACEYLISARVIRPGPVIVVKRVAHAREEAQRETFARLAHEFTDVRCAALDGLLVTDPEVKTTRLRWLATGPVEASPATVKATAHRRCVRVRPLVAERDAQRLAHTPARARERVSATATPLRKQTAAVAGGRGRPSRPTAAAVGEGWPWGRPCPCEGEVEIRWVVLEPAGYAVLRPEPGGLSTDADRAPIRFPRRARLYV
ncbi:DUF4158 domain-containing protein [Streptosporangium amethystogenes]|uniref:DUF4158 domain-containing protein n=1 Tax=Streptosporangium amethystogenes TaxID=2002 RepID=UPI00056D90AF